MKRTVITSAAMLLACVAMADYKSSMDTGNKLQRERKHEEAVASFKTAVSEAGNLGEKINATNSMARSMRETGNVNDAIAAYKTMLESVELSANQEAGLLRDLGNTYMDMGKLAEAIETYKKVTGMTDADSGIRVEAYGKLGNSLFRSGDNAGALAAYEKATTLTDLRPQQLNQAVNNFVDGCVATGNMTKLAEAIGKFNLEDPALNDNDRCGISMTQSGVCMLLGRYDEAIRYAQKISAYKPNGWQRRNAVSNILEAGRRQGKADEAIGAARSLMIDGDKENADLLMLFADMKRGIAAAATIPLYEEALALPNLDENKIADISRRLADALRDARKFESALPLLEKSLASDKINVQQKSGLYQAMIACYNEMNQPEMLYDTAKNAVAAIDDQNQKFQIARNAANSLTAGLFGRNRNRYPQAIELLSMVDVSKINEGDRRDWYWRMADYNYNTGKTDKAIEYFTIVAKDPKSQKWQIDRCNDSLRKMGVKL